MCALSVEVFPASQSRQWTKVHGDGFCWIYAFLVATGFLTEIDFPHGDSGSCPPSPKASKLSHALAPHAFENPVCLVMPRFESGSLDTFGTYGGAPQFMQLLKQIQPRFRFFVLDQTRTWIKFAAFRNNLQTGEVDSSPCVTQTPK